MGFSLGKCIVFSAFASLVVFCACDRHTVGELPEVQKEHLYPGSKAEAEPASAVHTPAAKPTPADFFPAGSKP
jgi:hypothetical protein